MPAALANASVGWRGRHTDRAIDALLAAVFRSQMVERGAQPPTLSVSSPPGPPSGLTRSWCRAEPYVVRDLNGRRSPSSAQPSASRRQKRSSRALQVPEHVRRTVAHDRGRGLRWIVKRSPPLVADGSPTCRGPRRGLMRSVTPDHLSARGTRSIGMSTRMWLSPSRRSRPPTRESSWTEP
jgi:hypothetical protein